MPVRADLVLYLSNFPACRQVQTVLLTGHVTQSTMEG
jgi:hypothetical protein